MFRRQSVFFQFLLLVVLHCSFSLAESISFEAAVDSSQVTLGSAFQLTLTIHGSQEVGSLELPPIDGFDSRFVGPSTQVQVINGEYSSLKSFTYMLIPRKEGKFTLPAFEVKIKGETYSTRPIALNVLPASAGQVTKGAATDPSSDQQSLADRVKMMIVVPGSECFVHEEVPVTVKLYVRELPIQLPSPPELVHDGAILSDFSRPKQYQEIMDGKTYDVVEYDAMLIPTRDGTLSIGPATITGELVIRDNTRRNPFGSSSFNDDFFASFFNSYQKKPVSITADPVVFKVKPFPVEGKPSNFSGGVGHFTFDVSVSPEKVKAGDPVTVKMSVTGSGDLKTVKMPEIIDDDFKRYDPRIREQNGQKSLEQVIIPKKEGQIELAPLTFSFLDTLTGKYVDITRGPFLIQVMPLEQGQEFQAVGFSEKQSTLLKENLGNDIVFIKDRPGKLLRKKSWIQRNGVFLTVMVVYLHVWGFLYGVWLYRRKFASDPGLARRSVALRSARVAIKRIQHQVVNGDSRAFYTQLFNIFEEYISIKLNIPLGKTDFAMVEEKLVEKNIPKDEISHLKEIYDLAERARYASESVSIADMKRSLLDMEEILEAVERRVK